MKKIFFLISLQLTIGLFFLSYQSVQAKINLGLGTAEKAATGAGYEKANETTLAQNIGSVIRAILTISGVVFTALVFYAGYLWMTARGEESQVEKAKEIIESSIIGLVIALASFGITSFVMNKVATKTNPTALPAPK